MADLPLFPFTTQEDWYGELSFLSADASQEAISLAGRAFEMPITPAALGSSLIEPVRTLTMEAGGGLSLKAGSPNTLVFRVPRDVGRTFPRGEYTADVLEVVSGERHLFMPVRVRYSEPSGILSFISRFVGVTVSFSARLQPIVSPVAITGRQGAAGATIVNGVVPPVPADGKNGDYFIEDRTASGQGRRMYGPKAGGAWSPTPWSIQVSGIGDVPGLTSALAFASNDDASDGTAKTGLMTPDLTRRQITASIAGATAGTIGGAIAGRIASDTPTTQFARPGGSASRALQDRFREIGVRPMDFIGCVGDGGANDTAYVLKALQAANDEGFPCIIDRPYGVTSVALPGDGSKPLEITGVGAGAFIARDTAVQPYVLGVGRSNIKVAGRLIANATFRTNYACGFQVFGAAPQFLDLDAISVAGARIGYRFGSTDTPSGLVSEITLRGGHTYGCPIALEAIGTLAVLTVSGTHLVSSTGPSTDPAWLALPRRVIRSIGAQVNVNGGELLLTDTTAGACVEIQPLAGTPGLPGLADQGCFDGIVSLSNVAIETAAPLLMTSDPDNLTRNGRTHGLFAASDCHGYIGQDGGAFVQTGPTFKGTVRIAGCDFTSTVDRASPNVSAGGPDTHIYVDDKGFGVGFKDPIGGTIGGTVHFSRRTVLYAINTNGQAFAAGSFQAVKFANRDTGEARARFASAYDPATGVFTAPCDLYDVEVAAELITDRSGKLEVIAGGVEYGIATTGAYGAQAFWATPRLAAGTQVKIAFQPDAAASSIGTGPQNWFSIVARA